MFATLDDEMRRDDAREVSQPERVLKYGLIALGSILLSGGLYYAIQLFA